MAQKVQVLLFDDLDDGEAVETISFAYRGTAYEIDLSQKNVNAMDKALAKYVDAARKVTSRGRPTRQVSTEVDNKAVRVWANANGIEVSPRGRVPASVIEQFKAAGN